MLPLDVWFLSFVHIVVMAFVLRSPRASAAAGAGPGARVIATFAEGQRGGSSGAGAAGFLPGLAGGVRGGADGAAPVVVGGLDWLLLACSVRLYPTINPRMIRMTASGASHVHHDPMLLSVSGLGRRGSVP
jgi:hypothetical protein